MNKHKNSKSSHINNIRVNMHTYKLISGYLNTLTKNTSINLLELNDSLNGVNIMVNNDVPDGQADAYGVRGEFIGRIKLN